MTIFPFYFFSFLFFFFFLFFPLDAIKMHRILNRDLDERIFARQNLILREQELVQNSMTFRSRIEQKQDDSSKDNRKKNKKFSDKSKRHTLFNPGILLGKKERK